MKKDIHLSRGSDMHGRRTVLKGLALLALAAGGVSGRTLYGLRGHE